MGSDAGQVFDAPLLNLLPFMQDGHPGARLLYLGEQAGRFVSAREVSDHYPVPPRLLAEVLKDLCKEGLVESQRGAAGGYQLVDRPDQLSLGRIVQALEGPVALTGCEPMAAFHDARAPIPATRKGNAIQPVTGTRRLVNAKNTARPATG